MNFIILYIVCLQAEAAYKLALEYLDKAKKLDKDKKLKLQKEILQVGSKCNHNYLTSRTDVLTFFRL